jgi:hypothetical protein
VRRHQHLPGGRVTLGLGLAAAASLLIAALHGEIRGLAGGPAPAADSFQKGMVFGLFAREEAGHTDKGIAEMKELGVDSVSITIPWVIANVRSTAMAPRADMTPSDASLTSAIRKAHAAGMRVFLMPFLYVDHMDEGEWRGKIDPPDWKAWFTAYNAFIGHYAALAGREGVEYLSVGSELCSTESRRDDWLVLIRQVRAVYPGAITYSANWDHRAAISFIDALDYLGMNAYFKVSDREASDEEDLMRAWEGIRKDVAAWRASAGKPLIITEAGYPSRAGACVDPWNYEGEGKPDPAEQLRCYRAFQRTWSGEPGIAGVYFYLWWGEGGPQDAGYTPRGKPAAEVIKSWYTGAQRRIVRGSK